MLNSADNAVSALTENASRPATEGAIPWKRFIGLDRSISGDCLEGIACPTAFDIWRGIRNRTAS